MNRNSSVDDKDFTTIKVDLNEIDNNIADNCDKARTKNWTIHKNTKTH